MMNRRTKTSRFLRYIASFLVLLFLLLITVFIALNRDYLYSNPVLKFVSNLFGGGASIEDKFFFEANTDNVFAQIDGKLIVAATTGFQVFSDSGILLANVGLSFAHPAISVADSSAAVWDIGGTNVSIIRPDASVINMTAEGALVSVSVNQNGWFVLSCEEKGGSKGNATVYNASADKRYSWRSGEGYFIDSVLSPANTNMAALTLTPSGSKITAFSLHSINEQGAFSDPDRLFFELFYLSDSRLCAISDSAALFLDSTASFVSLFDFSDEYLIDYSANGNGFITLLLMNYRSGSAGRLITVDQNGKLIASIDVTDEVLSLSAAGRYVSVAYDNNVTIYNSRLNTMGVLTDYDAVRSVLSCPNGSAIIITGYGAALFSP